MKQLYIPEPFLADNQKLAPRRELFLHRLCEIGVELGEGQPEEEPGEVVVHLTLHDGPLLRSPVKKNRKN
jgi:hypothetical protein